MSHGDREDDIIRGLEDGPASPCVSICAMDERDVCIGCYRSAAEITDWFMASPAEKRAILDRARERRLSNAPEGPSRRLL